MVGNVKCGSRLGALGGAGVDLLEGAAAGGGVGVRLVQQVVVPAVPAKGWNYCGLMDDGDGEDEGEGEDEGDGDGDGDGAFDIPSLPEQVLLVGFLSEAVVPGEKYV